MTEPGARGIRERLSHEAKAYAMLAAYLFVCFAALYNLKAAVLAEEGVAFAPFAVAAVKAMVLAKFVMLGEALRFGHRFAGRPLIVVVLARSLMFLALLVVLTVIEHMLEGLIHGLTATEALREAFAGRMREVIASAILLWLVLLPYLGIQHIARQLGTEAWRALLSGAR